MKIHVMTDADHPFTRREFTTAISLAAFGAAAGRRLMAQEKPADKPRIKLGIDNFAVRAMGWKAPALIDYAATLRVDSLFITDLDAFEKLDDAAYLADLKSRAADKGLQIQVGTWSICPSSNTFKKNWGSAEEHLRQSIAVAQGVGSPVLRVVLGNGQDRLSPGGIEARIADTVQVLKACKSAAVDSGVKIAMENHAGDMQAWELVELIESAGKDFVGANMDSGNAVWTLEDPLLNLETLAPYVLTTSLRDSAIWESENGATVQWTAMGDGTVDLQAYFKRFAELCPHAPVHIETISGFNRELPYLKPDFWKAFPKAKAADFARFIALAKKGKPREAWSPPSGTDRKQAEQEYQKSEVERSIMYCREKLGLGLRS
jgi:sugar phosphate isomerase/epimerase